jgi:hypothetical protein
MQVRILMRMNQAKLVEMKMWILATGVVLPNVEEVESKVGALTWISLQQL